MYNIIYVYTYICILTYAVSSNFRSYLRAVNSGASPQWRPTRSRSKPPSFHLLPVTLCALPTHPRTRCLSEICWRGGSLNVARA